MAHLTSWLKKILSAAIKDENVKAMEPGNEPCVQAELLNKSTAYKSRGNALLDQGRLVEAAQCYRQAAAAHPGDAESYINLGFVLKELGRYEEAKSHFKQALLLPPASLAATADAYYFLGMISLEHGDLDSAIESFNKIIEIKPDFAEAHSNLGAALCGQGKLHAAVECLRKALSLKPDYLEAFSILLFILGYDAKCSPEQYLAEAKRYGGVVAARAQPYTDWCLPPAGQDIQRLRVGLVSGDLHEHPVGYFLESVLTHLNPARVELIAYPTNRLEDELTMRIKPRFAAWRPIGWLDDAAAARQIRDDGVHILIDLAGHTTHTGLPVFAWKPAPVQVSWLGYFASTGVPGMDYLLADPVSVSTSHHGHFIETIWYMPDTRLCFTPPATNNSFETTTLPAQRNGYITFGCFQNLSKINDAVLGVWGRIFQALPQARLRLQIKQLNSPGMCEVLRQRLATVGIAPERVTMQGSVVREAYLAAHATVDIILDTFPYPGGTTTCEALWMGVPTLTLGGDTLLKRQGASLMSCAGLTDWIANDEEDYVARAITHASNIEQLTQLRLRLRENVLASPLFDAPRFARYLEDALHGMWKQKMNSALLR